MANTDLFDWDVEKASVNLKRHGVSFEEATTVFLDPLAISQPDDEHSSEEERFLLVGRSARRRLLVVAYTERDGVWRIISARPATRREREDYEDHG